MGRAFGSHLRSNQIEVTGICRSQVSLNALKNIGITPLKLDLSDPQAVENLPQVDYVLVCPAPNQEGDHHQNTYVDIATNLTQALKAIKPKKTIWISSTSVFGDREGEWVNEDTVIHERQKGISENLQQLILAEEIILKSDFPSLVFRLSGIYGPGRNRIQAIRSGEFTPKITSGYTNRMHLDDIVAALDLVFKKGELGQVYLGVDDEPVLQSEFYAWLYQQLNVSLSENQKLSKTCHRGNKRCSNKKIKALGLKLQYPTFREGYSALIPSA